VDLIRSNGKGKTIKMRKRLFDKNISKYNVVINPIDSPSVTATVLSATTGTVVTLAGTTAGIDTVNASKATNVSGTLTAVNATINTLFKLPKTEPIAEAALTGADYYGAFYFSGLCLYVAKSGTWVSGTLGVG